MGGERGCCDKCAKAFIMAINIVIILIGGAILGAGVYWQLSPTGFYKEIFNHNIFNVPIISITIGCLLLLVGLTGFFGACCEVLILLKAYMGFLIIIMLVEVILAVGCVAMKTTVEEYASNRTLEIMAYYNDDTKDEEGILTKTIDLVQENFECCGVDTPGDWASINPQGKYNHTDQGTYYALVPKSCCKADKRNDGCGEKLDNKYVNWGQNTNVNGQGCKTAMWSFIENNLIYVGVVAGAIVILQIAFLVYTYWLICIYFGHGTKLWSKVHFAPKPVVVYSD